MPRPMEDGECGGCGGEMPGVAWRTVLFSRIVGRHSLSSNMKVKLKRTDTRGGCVIWSLTLGQTYEVIGIEADDYRIIDDTGDPVLFDAACFDVVDATEPAFWESSWAEGVCYAYPPEWNRPGFFEDYHDRNEAVCHKFWQDFERYYGAAAETES